MTENEQLGMFKFRERAKQLIDFSDMQMGKMHPSDIDAVIDVKGQAFIYIEYKYKDAPFPQGQEILLRRLVQMGNDYGIPSLAILARHKVDDTNEDVRAGETPVSYLYNGRQWLKPDTPMTVKELCTLFVKEHYRKE